MLVGNYTLHAYCDECNFFHEVTGGNYSEAIKELREAGWLVSRKEDYVACPVCNPACSKGGRHRFVDARNEHVVSGRICRKCGAIKP